MRNSTSFIAGLGIGLAAGVVAGAGYMKKKMAEAIEDIVHEEVQAFIDDFYRNDDDDESEEDQNVGSEDKYTPYNSLHPDTTNKPSPNKLFRDRDAEHPEDPEDESDILDESPISKEDDDMRDPKLISEDKFDDDESFDKETLYYYQDDDVLTDEEEHEIENELEFVGDSLDKYGFRNNDEVTIHVRNFEKKTDYEIVKLFSSYRD